MKLSYQALAGSLTTARLQVLVGPVLILMILAMMVLPLPPFALDFLFTFNIALSLMVLLVSMFTEKPLEFAAFPAVLLFTTLLRLSLNVASTRVVLMEGHNGGDAAGKVIEAFGEFLVGGNFAVGLVVFAILVIINFMVITKGAGRIAEVGARFTLDAMPGKQMAIDADLNAGLIGEEEARRRRQEVAQEAEFYGSMDGASKFVRGDAVAGIVIMVVNIIGGLLIGVMQHNMSAGDAAHTYVLLTIGDGLVAQIPALIISTAAGVTVSRVNTEQDVGQQLIKQLFVSPKVLYLAAGVIGLLGLVPGMPNFIFLLFTAMLGGFAWYLQQKQQQQQAAASATEAAPAPTFSSPEASWQDVQLVDTLGMEVGHRLIALVDDNQQGELLGRIKSVRKKFAQEVGFLPPVVHIRDNLELKPNTYTITLKGGEIGRAEIYPDRWLAINPGQVTGAIEGIETTDPAFGLPAHWIQADQREHAQIFGYTVVDASTVVATHLNHLLQRYSADLLGRQEVQQLVDKLGEENKALVDDVIPKCVTVTTLQRVLQYLLEEDVSIRDLRSIFDTLAEFEGQQSDVHELTARVRIALGRNITQKWFGGERNLQVMGLDMQLETMLSQALQQNSSIEPSLAMTLQQQTEQAMHKAEAMGLPPVLVVAPNLRPLLSHFLRRQLRDLVVLSQAEIPDDRSIQVVTVIGERA
ncbi:MULTISPECIES: flagellar biosynthesis protein FlhA [Idiomarinaceae]|uniref:Flagellar biosynthesis protein FlhA n=1 Tax=Pseudidiomarina fusca TaxID=2965078 RepID=A0ABU3KX47_9GAMM|nr:MULTISPECIES: flagellar biosynthesis protein FlhA [Idiomarinaceae]MDT7525726.1 flagellar biosynthesis protein FlhA [Pseudidiomarina sp. GXY010]MRJ42123.1 flagellar biosynthesis protein FlhA [Idiomarina sp. FeN1]NCU57048.1 flagellar biosynthesis protein FlhA [Idiomarina sp. FenA--70]NCU59757.1 flagellar biosynthesis protein FlhA [Idiomarina sp. FenBw--71]UUN13251.1 flagellar biosynthesis protein FlhA [Idiomarina loihiensis]